MEPTQIRLVVPPELDMTELLGQEDSLLRLIEDQFESDISVRGNQITISGTPDEGQAVSFTEAVGQNGKAQATKVSAI